MKRFAIAAVVLGSVFAIGCGSADPGSTAGSGLDPDPGLEVDDNDGKADGVTRPLGLYEAVEPGSVGVDNPVDLDLTADKTFTAHLLVECVMAPCDTEEWTGTYKFTKGSSNRYIRLTSDSGEVKRYAYTLDPGVLTLTSSKGISFEMMPKHQCETNNDCPEYQCPFGGAAHSVCENHKCTPPSIDVCIGVECSDTKACADGLTCEGYKCVSECAQAGGTCMAYPADKALPACFSAKACPGVTEICCMPQTDCRDTGCADGKYCTNCWGKYACIPNGAVC
jgi:hypothetical protein